MKNFVLSFILVGLYFTLYLKNYSIYYLNIFGYNYDIFRETPLILLIIGTLISSFILSFSNSFKDKSIRIFLIIFYLYSIQNFNVLSWAITDWSIFEWLRNVTLLNLLFFTMLVLMKIKRSSLIIKNNLTFKYGYFKIFLTFTIIYFVATIGLKFDLSLEESYIRRFASRENTPLITKYLISNLIGLLLPVGFFVGFKRRDYFLITSMILLSFILFSHEGAKSIFLKPLFVLLGYQIFKSLPKKRILASFLFLNLIIQILIITYSKFYESSFIDLLLHRAIYLPAKLATWHIDIYNSSSNLVNLTPAYYVGLNYLNNPLVNANSNFLVSLVARYGFMAAFILILPIARITVYLINQRRFNTDLSLVISILLAIVLSESEFQTTILNHGLLIIAAYKLFFYEKIPKV